ncbi:MAG: type II toxin-antitoxin system Phd/YefM family antitoxin [Rubrivivax sp.]|nr:type II toxin-antitoxin system Phd/YefM family antitoxin [Rubrivivax sp.]
MNVSSTDAKNRFGQVLDEAQKRPVVIEKSGRRHSVLMSAELFDQLVARAGQASAAPTPAHSPEAEAFYAQYKDWVDMQNEHFEKYGIFGEEYRTW